MRIDVNTQMGKRIQPAVLGEGTDFIACIKLDIGGFFACFVA